MRKYKRGILFGIALSVLVLGQGSVAAGESVIRIGMTAADIPRTSGQPDQGYEGNRFTGIPIYDSLVQWDLSSETEASKIVPGLALSWEINPDDPTKWIFKLRPGVTFHDGSPFDADVVVWNVDKVLNENAVQYDPAQIGATLSRMTTLRGARKIDDMTVEFTTSQPDAFLPINLTHLYMASPAHWKSKLARVPDNVTDEAERSKAAWTAFAADPSGTGPFRVDRFVPRERLELVKNDAYWDSTRRPKIDRLVLLPMPESSSRTAALLSGQVDWIEAPAPDAIAAIEARGYIVYKNLQPHMWPWQFSMLPDSPFSNRAVRYAANLCVDRASMVRLLDGLMYEATGIVEPGHPWRGHPKFEVRYDPDAARELMRSAGYSQDNPLKIKVQISASGSGQMQPLQMNEFLQQNLRECYFDVEFDVVEWNTLFTSWRLGAKDPSSAGADAINVSISTLDPFLALARFASKTAFPPVSNNWGYFSTPETEALLSKARMAFDSEERDRALARLHARIVDEAPFLFVAHDVSPRALSPKIKGVVQPRSWFIDFTSMYIE